MAASAVPTGAMGEEIVDRDGEIVVRVQQPGGLGDDAVAVVVGIVAEGDVKVVLEVDQAGHGVGRGAVHAHLAIVVDGHEAEGVVNGVVADGEIESIFFGDRLPVAHARAAHGIGADLETGFCDGFHVDHVAEIFDVGGDEIVGDGGGGCEGVGIVEALDFVVVIGQQFVGAVGDPAGGIGVGRPAVGRVVLEAAVVRRIMRRGDDHAVGQPFGAALVVGKNGVGDDGGGGVAAILVDHHGHAIGGENLQRGLFGRDGERVGILAHEERAGDALLGAVFADGLRNGHDVVFGKAGVQRGAAMAGGAESDLLIGIATSGWVS